MRIRWWLLIGLICFVAAWLEFLLNRVVVPTLGFYGGMLPFCGFVFFLIGAIGCIGGKADRWIMTLTGAAGVAFASHAGSLLHKLHYGVFPPPAPIPSREDVLSVLGGFVFTFVFAAPVHFFVARSHRKVPPGHCTQCRYNLTGNRSGACPECGTKIQGTYAAEVPE
jgi:hypothetical protein